MRQMTTLYIDVNIILDAVKNRKNLLGKDIAAPAFKLFSRAIKCEFHLIISKWTLNELYRQITPEESAMFMAMTKKKTMQVSYDGTDMENARKRAPGNFDDALHVVLAEKSKADMIVTRNVSDFLKIGTELQIKRPENI